MDRLPEGLRNPSKTHLEFDAKSVSKWAPGSGEETGPFWGLAPRRPPRGSQEVPKVSQAAFWSHFSRYLCVFCVTSEASLEPFAVPSEAVLDHLIRVLAKP